MRSGTYRSKPIDFTKFEAGRFVPFLFERQTFEQFGCGYCAMALLTGISPIRLRAQFKENHVSDKRIVRFLQDNEFSIVELTKANVTQTFAPLKSYHVILFSQLLLKGEATWCVLHDGFCYHNFDIRLIKSLEFVNRPLLSMYLVWHPRYNYDNRR